jgi:hypothetical protein
MIVIITIKNVMDIFIFFITTLGIEGIDNFKEGMHIRFASESEKGGDKLPGGVYGTSISLEKAVSSLYSQRYLYKLRTDYLILYLSHIALFFFYFYHKRINPYLKMIRIL